MFTFWQAVLLTFIVFLYIYTVLDRLCKCIEICSTNRSYKKFLESANRVELKGWNHGTSGNPTGNESGEESQNSNV